MKITTILQWQSRNLFVRDEIPFIMRSCPIKYATEMRKMCRSVATKIHQPNHHNFTHNAEQNEP